MADETKITESDLIFYYSRAHRLEKAPQSVRDLYKPITKRRFGFFLSLVDTKAKAMMLIAIVAMCLIVLANTYLLPDRDPLILGNSITADAMRYENSTFIVVKKEIKDKKAWTGIAEIITTSSDGKTQLLNQKVVFTDNKEEEFRFALPFEVNDLLLVIQTGDKAISLKTTSR